MRRFAIFMILLLTLVGVSAVWLWQDSRAVLNTPLKLSEPAIAFTIAPGTRFTAILDNLVDAGVVQSKWYLLWDAGLRGVTGKVQAGEYEIKSGMTPLDVLDLFIKGQVVRYAVTIVEGWTVKEMLTEFDRHERLIHTLRAADQESILRRIERPGDKAEGLFFPDTYYFNAQTSDAEILRRAFDRMSEKLTAAWNARAENLPYKSSYEALTMASIIEKETAVATERPKIAGVFIRRLALGMPLQTDPTVIYGLGDRFDGNLRHEDLQTDNPFNTYRHKGLTPTPIALPGEAAITAALHPEPGGSLYFVARGDGSHHFSASLDEHNQAVARYQLNRAQ